MTPIATFPVFEIPHFTDGDTLWVRRRWHVGWIGTVELLAQDDRAGVCVRLTDDDKGLNTPERGKVGWAQAGADLRAIVENWHSGSAGGLQLWVYKEKPDSFGRILGDLVIPATGGTQAWSVVTAMRSKGWAAYKP